MDPFSLQRFDEKGFPGLWPACIPQLHEKSLRTIEEMDRAFAERAFVLCREAANQRIGILSLSESESEPMWAHYACNHSGIRVTFDCNHPFFSAHLRSGALRKVEYKGDPVFISSKRYLAILFFCFALNLKSCSIF